jgi:hypothetical protein
LADAGLQDELTFGLKVELAFGLQGELTFGNPSQDLAWEHLMLFSSSLTSNLLESGQLLTTHHSPSTANRDPLHTS